MENDKVSLRAKLACYPFHPFYQGLLTLKYFPKLIFIRINIYKISGIINCHPILEKIFLVFLDINPWSFLIVSNIYMTTYVITNSEFLTEIPLNAKKVSRFDEIPQEVWARSEIPHSVTQPLESCHKKNFVPTPKRNKLGKIWVVESTHIPFPPLFSDHDFIFTLVVSPFPHNTIEVLSDSKNSRGWHTCNFF